MWTLVFIALALLSLVNISGIMKYGAGNSRYLIGGSFSLVLMLVIFGFGWLFVVALASIGIAYISKDFILSFVE